MEPSQGQTIYWDTEQVSVRLRRLRSYQASSPITVRAGTRNQPQKKAEKITDMWGLNNLQLNNYGVNEKNQRRNKKLLKDK